MLLFRRRTGGIVRRDPRGDYKKMERMSSGSTVVGKEPSVRE